MMQLTLVIVQDFIMLPDADKTIEHQDTVQSDNVEVPAAEELASVSV